MQIDPSRALGAYAAVLTVCLGCIVLTGFNSGASPTFREINVERINVREPDGTLRMTIADHARMPGIIDGKHEYPHPNRPEAGMIFFNNEGTENGGLVFDGAMVDGKPTNSGSLTFDRYHQDQTVQLVSVEDGSDRFAGLQVNDHPDGPMDVASVARILAIPAGPARDDAARAANLVTVPRAFLGRGTDKASSLVLRDGAGRKRLVLSVTEDGSASIQFLDAAGQIVRKIE